MVTHNADYVRCLNCGGRIEKNGAFGEWLHRSTAERQCHGYPHYGNTLAVPPCTCETFGNGVMSGNDGRLAPVGGCRRHLTAAQNDGSGAVDD